MKHLCLFLLSFLLIETAHSQLVSLPCQVSNVSVSNVRCAANSPFVEFEVNFTVSGGIGTINVLQGNNLIGSGTSSPITCSVHELQTQGSKMISIGYGFNDCRTATYTHPICTISAITDIQNGDKDALFGQANVPMASDPCGCNDPDNIRSSQGLITHFHDVLEVLGTVGEDVVLTSGGSYFLDGNLVQIPDNTNLGTIPASGVFEFDFFHASGPTGNISLTVGGVAVNPTPLPISVCNASDCPSTAQAPIPTMSEWGTMIFCLLILNLGLIFLREQSSVLLPR